MNRNEMVARLEDIFAEGFRPPYSSFNKKCNELGCIMSISRNCPIGYECIRHPIDGGEFWVPYIFIPWSVADKILVLGFPY